MTSDINKRFKRVLVVVPDGRPDIGRYALDDSVYRGLCPIVPILEYTHHPLGNTSKSKHLDLENVYYKWVPGCEELHFYGRVPPKYNELKQYAIRNKKKVKHIAIVD